MVSDNMRFDGRRRHRRHRRRAVIKRVMAVLSYRAHLGGAFTVSLWLRGGGAISCTLGRLGPAEASERNSLSTVTQLLPFMLLLPLLLLPDS